MMNHCCYLRNVRPILVWVIAVFYLMLMVSALAAAADKVQITVPDGIPADLFIVYSTGATHAEWGRSIYQISADGSVVHEKARGPLGGGSGQTKYYRLTEKELRLIVQTIRKSNFFSLNQLYEDPQIRDGWSSRLLVTMDHKTHSVSVMNVRQKEFDEIAFLISDIINKKKPVKPQ